jgi:hypothetical protein
MTKIHHALFTRHATKKIVEPPQADEKAPGQLQVYYLAVELPCPALRGADIGLKLSRPRLKLPRARAAAS